MVSRLQHIAESEKITTEKKVRCLSSDFIYLPHHFVVQTFESIIKVSEGDMRRAISIMHSANRLVKKDEKLSSKEVNEVAGVCSCLCVRLDFNRFFQLIPDEVVTQLIATVKTNNFQKLQDATEDVVMNAYPVNQVLAQV
jgi:DNA polymerase III delta prime subunit